MLGHPAMLAQDVQAAFAGALVDEWARAGVTDVVVCPGSRSTPVLVAVGEAAEQGRARLHVVLDERSAGFFALGLGRASGRPAVVVTTSGTAAAELHPAVIEAHHAGVPLLAVTADRPAELQDCGAPQTIRQPGLFGECLRWESAPGVPDLAAAGAWRSLASRAVLEALGGAHRPGPVHLNLAFREPLLGSAAAVRPAIAGRPGARPWHRARPRAELLPPPDVVDLLAKAGERVVVVAGNGAGDDAQGPQAVRRMARATGWPVLADPLSGCRTPGSVASADALLRAAAVRQWQPDLVLRLGAPWASRVVNEWLAGLQCPQVLVDPWGAWAAPDRSPGEVVVASPGALCRAVAERADALRAGTPSDWAKRWALAEKLAQGAIDAALTQERALTEPGIARCLVSAVPRGSNVVVSSSMPVRDVEWWAKPRDGVRFLANRGANGIDGVLSTALGVAAGSGGRPSTALMGDLAFLYDAGALLGASERGLDLDVVVVDNDGGGIFNFLPQASGQPPERFERLWGTPHGADLCALSRAYGASVEEVPDLGRLGSALSGGGVGKGLRIFVARTDRAANVTVHRSLHTAVDAALTGLA